MDNTTSGSSWTDFLSQVLSTGGQLGAAALGHDTSPATATTPAAAPATSSTKEWLLIGGIGAAVLVLVLVLARK